MEINELKDSVFDFLNEYMFVKDIYPVESENLLIVETMSSKTFEIEFREQQN